MNKNILYFDIETTSEYENLSSLKMNDDRGYELWLKKYKKIDSLQKYSIEESYINNAALYSTWGKIVCISFVYYSNKFEEGYKVNSLIGNEQDIMFNFNGLLNKSYSKGLLLSGYKILSFDIPFVTHKLYKYNINLNNYFKPLEKPWESKILDLADYWKMKGEKYSSLDEVAYELGVKSPKDDIDGSEVYNVFWKENNINRIKNYCEKDVLTCLEIGEKIIK
jgi:hypothetical protein